MEHKTYPAENEKPHGCWTASPIHGGTDHIYDSTHSIFSEILLLVVGLALPIFGVYQAKNVLGLVAYGSLGSI
jgi:hypothetical protein